ncbi:MAG: tandem-95 repeat protein [Alphaproteobacteria bacterium]
MSVFTLTNSADNFTGNSGENNEVFLTPVTLQSVDTVTGGALPPFIDVLTVTAGGTITAAQFAGVTNFEVLNLSNAGNKVSLTNGLVAGADKNGDHIFSVVGGSGDDTVDASGVTNSMRLAFVAGAGNDHFIGGNGNDTVLFATTDLTSADVVSGGNGFDFLAFSTGGAVSATALANVTSIEEVLLSNAGNTITLSNAFVAGADNGVMSIVDGTGNDTVDASGVTNGTRVAFYTSSGNETFTGGSGSDYVSFHADQLTSADHISGGANFDIIEFDTAGTVSASAFANVIGIDEIILNAGGNNVTIGNVTAANADNGVLVVVDTGGAGNDTVNASPVASNRVVFQSNGGNDSFTGGGGSDVALFTAAGLTSADTFAGGAGFDVLQLTTAGTVGAAAFTNFTGVDELFLTLGGNNITLNGGVVANSDNAVFVVVDQAGNNTVNASAATLGGRVVFNAVAGDHNTYTGGTGSDFFQFADANLNNTDTLVGGGGAGTDFLQVTTAASVTAADLANVSQMEVVQLLAGGSIALGNSVGNAGGFLEVDGTAAVDSIDGSAVSGYDLLIKGSGGADTLKGGAGNDQVVLPDTSFAAIDGNGGFDKIILTSAFDNQTFDLTSLASKITHVEAITLEAAAGATLQIAPSDIAQVNSTTNLLYVVAGSDDQVNVNGTGWTQVATGQTNANLPGHTFVQYHNSTTNSDLFIDALAPTSINLGSLGAVADSGTAVEDVTGASGNLIANDKYTGGGTLSISDVTGATDGGTTLTKDGTYGRLVVTKADGNYTYTLGVTAAQQDAVQHLATGAQPTETFNYTVTDGGLASSANLVVTVFGTNDAPSATAAVVSNATEDTAYSFNVSTLFTDIDSNPSADTLTYSVAGLPAGLSFAGSTISGTPTNDDVGSYTISVTANDGHSGSLTRTFSFSVANTNDAPVGNVASYTINEDTPLSGSVSATDVDGDSLSYALVGGSATNGSATVNSDGTFTFTPTVNFNGDASFQFTANDGTTNSAAQTVTIHVSAVNDAPFLSVPGPQAPTEDVQFVFNGANTITVQDVDSGAATNFSVGLLVDHGSLQLVAQGGAVLTGTDGSGARAVTGTVADVNATLATLKYTGAPNFNGIDTLVITANDNGNTGSGGSLITTSTVQLNVSAANDAPTANADTININEDQTPTINVLGNDFDPDGPFPLSIARINGALVNSGDDVSITGGSLHVNGDGSLKFTPTANLNNTNNSGPVTFTYTPQDGNGLEAAAPATVTINLTAVNDTPTPTNDSFTVNENGASSIGNVITGNTGNGIDSDVETANSALKINGVRIAGVNAFTTVPSGGSATLTFQNGAQVQVGSDGSVTLLQNGAFESLATGQHDEINFQYRIIDTGDGASGALTANANVQIIINGQNDAPTSAGNTLTTFEDTAYTLKVSDFPFSDVDSGDSIKAVKITALPSATAGVLQLDGVNIGTNDIFTASQISGGHLTFVPTGNFNGSGSFSYLVQDQQNAFAASAATMSLAVTAVNDAPVAHADTTFITPEDQGIILDILANDTDVEDGIPSQIASVNGTALTVGQTVGVIGGTVTLNAAGDVFDPVTSTLVNYTHQTLTFTPDPNSNVDSAFAYTARDSNGTESAQASVSVDVTPVNDPPVAQPDSFTTLEDTPVTFDVRANDTDVDSGTTLVVTHINGTPFTGPGNTITLGDGATVHKNANGTLTYTPAHDVNGPPASPPSFTYTVSDGLASSTSTVNINITPVNDAPVNTVPSTVTATEDTTLSFTGGNQISVTDVDSNVTVTLSVDHGVLNLTGPGVHGSGTNTVTIDSASPATINTALSTLTYLGDSNFNGNDTLTMVTSDGSLHDTDTVAISVTAVADVSLYDSSNNLIATFDDLETAVLYAQNGQHIRMAAGNIALEGPGPHDGQVFIDKDITIEGAGKLTTTLSAATSIANAQLSSSAAMIVVKDGHTVDFSNFTLNGNDQSAADVDVSTGILFDGGDGSVTNMRLTNFGADVGDEPRGTGVVAWAGAQVSVTNSDFDQNERRDLAAFDSGTHVTIADSTFTAKTTQDESASTPGGGTVDYGVQASDGALVDISGSTFNNFSASENGFGSAGLLVAPTGTIGSTVNLNGNANTFTNNSVAIAAGFNATDTDIVNLNGTVTVNSTVPGALGLQAFGDVVVTGVPADLSGGVVTVDWQGGPNGNAIFGDDQNDTLQGNGGNDTILAGGGDDAITYNAGDGSDTVDGGSNTATGDTLTINGTAATETFDITGGSPSASHIDVDVDGLQAIDVTDVEEIVVNTNGGGDTVNISGSFGGTTLHTNSITVNGDAGNDTVNASGLTSTHSIHFTGGGGDDTFVSSNAGGDDAFDGGANGPNGDTVDYSAITGGAVRVDLANQLAQDIGGTGVGVDDLFNVENVIGTAQNDIIRGDANANTLSGGGGDDTLEGRGGNDTIYGGTSVGDSGHDTAVFTGNRADYTITRIGSGVYTVADSVGGRDATDTVHDIETLHFNGDASDVLLDAPIQVFDATDTVLLATFQANQLDQAVSYANTHAGANVIELQSSASPFSTAAWPVDITEAVTIKAVGGTATVNSGSNSAFTIEASAVLGASDAVRLEGLNITGNGTTGDTVGVFFNGTYEGSSDGAIQLVATSVSGFGSDGVAIIGGGAGLTVTVDGDNPNLAGTQTATFTGSGYSSTSGGSGDILFFEFTGAAALKNINVIGTTGTAASSADNGIQFAGFDGADHSVDHAIGSVSFQTVSVTGTYEKTLVYVQGYDNLSGLNFASGLTVGSAGSATTWTGLFIDGGPQGGAYVTDGTSTLDLTGVVVNGGSYGTSPSFAALGSKPIVVNGVVTGDVITGTPAAEAFIGSTGDDTINAGGGNDLILYNVGDGHDTVDGQGGTDTLGLVNLSAGVPSATPTTFAVSESGGHLIVQTDGTGLPEVDAAGMESVQFVLGNGGDTVTLTGNIGGAGIATGPGGIIVTGGTGGDTLDASGLTSANAITFSSLGGGNDTFKAANVVANDTVDGAGGTGDSLDYSAASAAVSIDLAAGTASGSSVGSDTVANYENATGGAGGDTISGTSGANTLSGNGGDDTLTGRGGADTLVGGETGETHGDVAAYTQVITAGMIATNGSGGWTVTTAGAEGTDTLSEIEVVQGADPGPGTGKFLLVGNGGYATIAAAYAEAVDGDTIVLAPGTYAGDFTVGKAISIVGANYNVDGAGTRGPESVLTGHWTVNAAGPVAIDGVEFLNNTPYTTGIDDTRLTIATDATVAHSLFFNTRPGGNKPISDIAVNVTATTGTVSITDNRFTGDFHGKYFNGNLTAGSADSASWGGGSNAGGDAGAIVWHGGSTLGIDGNTIEFARTALTLLNGNDSLLTINDNDFVTNGTSVTATGWQGPVTTVTNNAFTDVDNEFNLRSNTTGVDINFGATGNTSDNWFSVLGTTGVDTITGTGGKDAILAEQGDDTIHTGAGNDSIFFNTGSGNDTVDGGSESGGKDTLIVSNTASPNNTLDPGDAGDPATSNSGGPSGTAATFNMTVTAGNPVIPTDGTDSAHDISIVAQTTAGATPLGSVTADEIEDVQFNLGNGGDTVNMSGDFSTTSLSASTITVNGGSGADTVDARNLSSAHAIHFYGNGGDDYFYVSGAGGNDTFDGGTGTNTIDYSDVGHAVTVDLGNNAAQNTGDGLDTISNVQNVVGTGFDDTLTGTAGANRITGGAGIDTSSYSGTASAAATFGFDGSGHWTVTIGSVTDTLIGVEKLVFSDKTILLVDHDGANVGGFQTVQSAIDYASGDETILIKGATTYSESHTTASGPAGIYIDKPGLTLQGVTATGALITDAATAQSGGPTIVSAHQNNFGANHWVDVNGDNTVFNGVHLQAGTETNNKLLEVWAENVTVQNSFVDVNEGGTNYTFAVAIYFNDNGSAATDEITKYTVDHNILNEGIVVANGVGDPSVGIGANQKITNNQFEGVFDDNTGVGRYDTIVINGQVAGIGWLLEPTQTPTISGNTFANNTTPFLMRGSDNNAANFPTAAQIATILANNGDNNLHYAYVLTPGGDLEVADRDDGSGPYHSFAVTNTIDTLNLALDTTADNVFGGQRNYIKTGDTVVIQSGDTGTLNSSVMVENLTIKATAHSADLNLTLATQFADTSAISGGGVHNVTLADYAAGQGANVDVTGNTLDNVIIGNSGNNTLDGSGGNDTLHGGGGNDSLIGGAGTGDKATYDDARANYTLVTTAVDGFVTAVTDVTETPVTGTNEGHDILSGIEVLSFNNGATVLDLTQNVQLFDSTGKLIGTFDTIQGAVDAAATTGGINETIRLRDGVTYTEQVTIDGTAGTLTGLTIIGANVDGNPSTGATIQSPAVLGVNGFSDHFGGGTDVRAGIAVKNVTGVTISNVTVDGNYAGDTTSGSNGDEIAGIAYLHASGTIEGVHVENTSNSVGGGLFGLQHGSGIFSDNGIGTQQSLTITNSTIDTFQKTGVLLWNVNVDMRDNTVTGVGPSTLIAQNAMQIGGSQGTIGAAGHGNTFEGVGYSIPGTTSTDLIVYEPSGDLTITANTLKGAGGAGQTVGLDLTDVDPAVTVTVTNNAFGATGFGLVDGTDAYTFDGTIGLGSDPVMSGNTFTGITQNGIFLDPEFVVFPPAFSTNTAFTETGTQFDDVLHGSNGADNFSGGAGADDLMGRLGIDTINGGAGNDTITWRAGDGNDSIDGGNNGAPHSDDDTLEVVANGHDLTLTANGSSFTVAQDDAAATNTATVTEVEDVHITLNGGENITLVGDFTAAGVNVNSIVVDGSAGTTGETVDARNLSSNQHIDFKGGSGNDTFIESNAGGNDSFNGGDGVDTVDYSHATGPVTVNLSSGTATGAGTDTLTNVENAIGTGGNDSFIGNSKDNAFTGGGGTDTVHFSGSQSGYAITVNNDGSVTVHDNTSGRDGTDTVSGVELLDFHGTILDLTKAVRLFDHGNHLIATYDHIQDAVTAADSSGETIRVAAGTFHETVTIGTGKDGLTIEGANVGVSGTAARDPESSIDAFFVSAAGVTINGVKVTGVANNNGEQAGVMIAEAADSFTMTDSLLVRDGSLPPPNPGFISFGFTTEYGQQNDHLVLTNNSFSGWDAGAYLQGGVTLSDATVTGNAFDGNSLISDADLDPTSNVSANTFTNGAGIGYGSTESENVGAVIGANTFDTTPGVEIDYYVTANGQSDIGTVNADQMLGSIYWNPGTANLDQTFEGGAGADLLYGAGGTDTAHYTGPISASSIIAQNVTVPAGIINGDATADVVAGWQVATGGSEGTDKLVDIEIVDGSEPGKFLLVGNGGFDSIQDAIDAASAGDTIIVASGSYSGHVNVNKAVTILGANAGKDGNDSAHRVAESILTGGVEITVAGATIDGVEISGSYNSATDLPNGLFIQAADATVKNSVFLGDGTAVDSRPGSTTGGATGLNFSHNLVKDWGDGFYVTNGGSGSIAHNTFVNDGNGINSETTQVDISNNSFTGSIGPDVVPEPFVDAVIGDFVHDNTYSPTLARPISVYLNGPAGQDVVGSDVPTTYHPEYHNGAATIEAGAGSDAISFSDNSAPVTIDLTAGTASTASNVLGNPSSVSFTSIENAIGGSGNDTLTGNGVTSALDGRAGIDTVVYSGVVRADISIVGGHWTITGPHGTDTLSNVEKISDGSGHTFLLVGDGGFTSIQAAVSAAGVDDTILVASDTYHENVTVSVAGLTIEGIGAVTLAGTFKSDNHIADGGVADFLEAGNPYSQTAGRGFDIAADSVTIKNVTVDGFTFAVNLADGTDGATLDNVTMTDNLVGIHKGTTASITNFTVNGGSVSDGLIGLEFYKDLTSHSPAGQLVGIADGVTIDGMDFSNLSYKGIYVEALSHAHLTNIDMNDVGQFGAPSTSGTTGSGGNGIDLNLKNGTYSDIEIDNFHLTDTGASDQNDQIGHPSGHQNGGAIVVEARDFGTYLNVPGIVTDTVSIHDGIIDGHTSTGIQVGEPNQSNLDGPATTISKVLITGEEHTALPNGHGDVANVTAASVTVNMLNGGDSLIVSPTTTGQMIVNGGTGADTITTGSGNDTLNGGGGSDQLNGAAGTDLAMGYSASATITFDGTHWQVHDGSDVDTLIGVEKVVIGSGPSAKTYLLVDHAGANVGGYQAIQSAASAGVDGDTVLIAAGQYVENVAVGTAISLVGLNNQGIAGTGVRTAESEIDGQITVTTLAGVGDKVTFDGLKIENTSDNATSFNGITVSSGVDVDIRNSVFHSPVVNADNNVSDKAIFLTASATGTIVIEDNLVTGDQHSAFSGASWSRAIWSDGRASSLTIQDNTIEWSRTAINSDDHHDDYVITHNTIQNDGTGMAFGDPSGGPVVSTFGSITDNTFINVGDDFNLRNLTAPATFDADHALLTVTSAGPTDLVNVLGGSGSDTLSGTDFADMLDANNSPTLPNASDNDILNGHGGNDQLFGRAGDDTLDGGADSDTVNGGDGNDHIIGNIDGAADTYNGDGNDLVNAVAGTGGDTIDYSATTNGISVTLSGGAATVVDDEAGTDTLTGIENVTGGSGDDIITGDNNANILIGGAGADSLTGSGGADRLVGGSGADNLSGGTGADVFVYEHRSDAGTAAGGQDLISGYSVTDSDTFAFKADFFNGVTLPGDFNDGTGHVASSYFLVTNVGDDAAHSYGGAAGQPIFVLDDVTAGFAGTLWFDAEGDGQLNGAKDVKIADLSNASVLTGFSHNDLLLI